MRKMVQALCIILAIVSVCSGVFGCRNTAKSPETTKVMCKNCSGTGKIAGICGVCQGSGQKSTTPIITCDACGGHGSVLSICPECSGTGKLLKNN